MTFLSKVYLTCTGTKDLVVHSLSPAADREVLVKDDDIEVSDDSADMKSRKESSKLPSGHSLSKLDRNISTPVLQ